MFVYTVRASTLRFAILVLVTLGVLGVLIGLGGAGSVSASSDGVTYRFTGVKDEEGRLSFLSQFGIAAKQDSASEEKFTMPKDFDRVLVGYNEVQKKQGLDLTKYGGKKVTRYTYEVENGDYEGAVLVNLIVYRGRVVGADVSGGDPEGFVIPLTEFRARAT